MAATILKWLVILLATLNFSYMAIDGTVALAKGDYIRPKTGAYAGQLGPWAQLVKNYGIDPESKGTKTTFVIWGITGIIITICYAFNLSWSWKALLFFNVLSLWYLFAGTITSILQIALILLSKYLRKTY